MLILERRQYHCSATGIKRVRPEPQFDWVIVLVEWVPVSAKVWMSGWTGAARVEKTMNGT